MPRHLFTPLCCSFLALSQVAFADDTPSREKLDNDPTKVTTKIGVSWSDTYDLDDSNLSFSGSVALDAARKLNARVNSDASEWRVGGSWLFPVGILNFNFGKNEYSNGASQTNYSVGTFVPLSHFGIEPAGFQIFPMAGYTYNTGEITGCSTGNQADCKAPEFADGIPSEYGFSTITTSGSSGYLGAFTLRPVSEAITLLGFAAGSYGSRNEEGEHYHGYFGGLGMGYHIDKHSSVNLLTFIMDNNTYLDDPDKRFLVSYTWQFE